MTTDAPIRWFEAEPQRFARELEGMQGVGPDLTWQPDLDGTTGGGWVGLGPIWPFSRSRPAGLAEFLNGRRFRMEVVCGAAYPAAAPRIRPIEPEPDLSLRTMQQWHVMGDGTLCLLQNAGDWTGRDLAAELVVKAAGWHLEYLLLQAGAIEAMTGNGIAESDELDHLLAAELWPEAPFPAKQEAGCEIEGKTDPEDVARSTDSGPCTEIGP